MEEKPKEKEHGGLYWFCYHTAAKVRDLARRNRGRLISTALVILALLFLFRAFIQPLFLAGRKYLFLAVIFIALAWLLRWVWRQESAGARALCGLLTVLLCGAIIVWGRDVHRYLALYLRYSTISIVELEELPVTDHERIQPLNSIFSLAHEVMTESETPMLPDFVRVGDDYRWTIAIEPSYLMPRFFGTVHEIFNLPGTAPSPDFSKTNRIPVHFETGEKLLLSHNSSIATIRTFGLWRYLNYEPSDVAYVKNDEGEWVQVVSLIRWRGFMFPRPEFGGVQVIRQQAGGFLPFIKLLLFGAGEWIPAAKIAEHPYLLGQNILPYQVSRYIGNSFRFQGGFYAPLPGYHRGDVRIPNLPEDINDQPFAAYFKLPGQEKGKLYHYCALEPYDPQKQGLNTSVFIPADGEPKVFVYKHFARSGSLTGVSAVAAKVMESRKMYDWVQNHPVEHRPFIKNIDGKIRFFWLTTVVTFKEREDKRRFIAGSIPDVVLTDATFKTSIWVDPLDPASWLGQLKRELEPVWASG